MHEVEYNAARLDALLQRMADGEIMPDEIAELQDQFKACGQHEIEASFERMRQWSKSFGDDIERLKSSDHKPEYIPNEPPERGFQLFCVEGGVDEAKLAAKIEEQRYRCAYTLIKKLQGVYSELTRNESCNKEPDRILVTAYYLAQKSLDREADDLEEWDHSRIERVLSGYSKLLLEYRQGSNTGQKEEER